AEQFRHHLLQHADELTILFSNVAATGEFQYTANSTGPLSQAAYGNHNKVLFDDEIMSNQNHTLLEKQLFATEFFATATLPS
ncbi:hypothetical protein U1Q18_043017, partial [Sarracenia purpurea var. burkii]